MANSELYWIQSFYLTNIVKVSNFGLWLQILKNLQFVKIRQNLKYFYAKETRIIENASLCTALCKAMLSAPMCARWNSMRDPFVHLLLIPYKKDFVMDSNSQHWPSQGLWFGILKELLFTYSALNPFSKVCLT